MSVAFTVFKGSANDGIVEATTSLPSPTGTQVQIKITHSGICGTDEHYKHLDMVLGHEGVGIVEHKGENVTEVELGHLVGWGFYHKTCGRCELCLRGQDQYCLNKQEYGTANHHQGSFGSRAIWDESCLYKIPPEIKPEHAAPLMCGGATVFEVIETYNIRPTDRVGVVGVGGLGHLAILFLAKMGCNVVVFSSTESKREDALNFGASEFYITKGIDRFDVAPVDHLIVTTSFLPNWKPYLDVVKRRGTIYPLTVSPENLSIPSLPLIARGIKVQGSVGSTRGVTLRMLDFVVRNKIEPVVELLPFTKAGVEEGMARLREGSVRYRAVLAAED
ncbi:putative NADP-dependent alcohol dehydrogenase C 2 [Roridomyces roridus]|uniref:NADP-dependent alcohol dehydrogenase C 2 n=1 Tax=Roridomyces roridus TaxID=1738132 RepID=A0AAD7CEN2_9AGAR|nr:putative NADP-dependent alcohol dehydrogenase C 2 [Roridomyces roridus]